MLKLIAKAVHISGETHEVVGHFDANGGTIGRSTDCHMALPDPDRRISRTQAQIRFLDDGYSVHNASTSNPMYLNGAELPPGSSQAVRLGDEMRAGSYLIAVAEISQAIPSNASVARVKAAELSSESARPAFEGILGGGHRADALAVDPDATQLHSNPAIRQRVAESSLVSAGSVDPLLAFGGASQPLTSGASPFDELLAGAMPLGGVLPDTEPLPQQAAEVRQQEQKSRATAFGGVIDVTRPVSHISPVAPSISQVEVDVNPLAKTPPVQSLAPKLGGVDPLSFDPSRLAGDPFADLLSESVSAQLASAPNHSPQHSLGTYIPDDFNPLAFGGVSQRNAEDPLSPLGLGARGMEDVLPTKTIDSIYAPNDSAADELVVDPLDLLGDAFLNVGGTLDPMELFAADSGALGSLDQPSAARSSRAVDNAPEMKSYFRAPIAVSLAAEEGRVAPVIDVSSAAVQALANPIADDAHDAHDASGGVLQTLDAAQEIATPMSAPPAEKDETNESGKEDDSHESQALRHLSDTGSGIVPSMESSVGRTLSSKQVEVPAVDASETKDLLFAFKRGAGLLDSQCPVSLTPEVMEKIGEMLKLAVQGSMDLLNARAVVKQEVKLSVTLINPDANNPLKFLPNSAVALTQMFGPRMPGFMSATEAMGDAYDDLVAHQTAMAAGTQAAVEAIFNRFDPDALEAKREKRGVAEKLLPNAWKSQLWDAYRAQFDNLRDDIKGDFFNRLGAEFQEAYETEHEKSRTNSRG